MEHLDPGIIALLAIIFAIQIVFVAIELYLNYKKNQDEIEMIRKYLNDYAYDYVDSEKVATLIHETTKKQRKNATPHDQFVIISGATDPFLDPAKTGANKPKTPE